MKELAKLKGITEEILMNQIYLLRGQKIMLDFDLSDLYGIETRVLKQSVRRNISKFPMDFMFELSKEEFDSLRSHYVILKNSGRGKHPKYLPYAFTEHGVLMLSSVIRSEKADLVNIQIMRLFVRIRNMLTDNNELHTEVASIKDKLQTQGQNIESIFQYLDAMMEKNTQYPSRPQIGFKIPDAEKE
jgi:hypothetical protein